MRIFKDLQVKHWQIIAAIGTVLGWLLGSLFGEGVLFRLGEVKRDQSRLESELMAQSFDYEKSIHELVPIYVTLRDRHSDETPYSEILEYYRHKSELIALLVSYNKNEARLSQLQERGAQLLLPALVIPPRPPKITSIVRLPAPSGSEGNQVVDKVSWDFQDDEVVTAVNSQLELLLEQYGESFRNEFYLQACKAKQAQFCTHLAARRSGSPPNGRLSSEVRDLYQQGCAHGDPMACEALAFDDFNRKEYIAAEQWLVNACVLRSGNGCGFLGSLRASKLLAERQNAQQGRADLDKGCELRSARSCYYSALVYVSSLVDRDEDVSKARLAAACSLGLDEACASLKQFEDFKACSPEAFNAPSGDIGITIECIGQKSTSGPANSGPKEF